MRRGSDWRNPCLCSWAPSGRRLIEAGASPEKAAKAAEEVGTYENRLAGIEAKLALLDGRVNLVQWMLGFNLAMTLAVAGRLFLTH
jgi:hypothetical protein